MAGWARSCAVVEWPREAYIAIELVENMVAARRDKLAGWEEHVAAGFTRLVDEEEVVEEG